MSLSSLRHGHSSWPDSRRVVGKKWISWRPSGSTKGHGARTLLFLVCCPASDHSLPFPFVADANALCWRVREAQLFESGSPQHHLDGSRQQNWGHVIKTAAPAHRCTAFLVLLTGTKVTPFPQLGSKPQRCSLLTDDGRSELTLPYSSLLQFLFAKVKPRMTRIYLCDHNNGWIELRTTKGL